MHRALAILFLMLLPLQFSWAAVVSYCEHEIDVEQQQHFGHHEHEHELADNENELGADDEQAGIQLDCGHGTCCNVTGAERAVTAVAIPSCPHELDFGEIRSAVPDPPYRPQWFSLA